VNQEGRALRALFRDGSESALAAARARMASLSEGRTASAAAQSAGVSAVTWRAWKRLAEGERKAKPAGPTLVMLDVHAKLAKGDLAAARATMLVALESGIERASQNLGVSPRVVKSLIQLLSIELPRGRPLASEEAAPIKNSLYSTDPVERERGIALLRLAITEAGNAKAAARALGISYRTILGWRNRFGV
jgi:transposase-like protein